MRKILATVLFLVCGTAAAEAPSLDDIIAAYGGGAALQGIETYAARLSLTDIWAYQSPTPGPPWRTSQGLRCFVMESGGNRYAEYERRIAAGFYPFHSATWLENGAGWRFNLYDGWRRRLGGGNGRVTEALRFAPVVLVARMARAPERVESLGVEDGSGSPRALFRFRPDSGEPVLLAFDVRTRMLRTLTAGEIVVRYDGYEIVDGLPVSRRMAMDWRGETVWRLHLDEAAFNPGFPDLPEELEALEEIAPSRDENPRRFQVRTLAPGIHFIGEGVRYQLFVEFRDFVVALGGVGGVEKRLSALRELTGDKPLRYALITHHHADHLEGIPALVDAGAVIVTSRAHEALVREAAGPARQPALALVDERREITDGERTLVFREIGPMRHSKHMLAGLVPEERLLFSADLFVQPPQRPIRSSITPIRELEEALRRLDLDAVRFVDPHSPVISNLADLRLAAEREGNWSGFEETKRAFCPP